MKIFCVRWSGKSWKPFNRRNIWIPEQYCSHFSHNVSRSKTTNANGNWPIEAGHKDVNKFKALLWALIVWLALGQWMPAENDQIITEIMPSSGCDSFMKSWKALLLRFGFVGGIKVRVSQHLQTCVLLRIYHLNPRPLEPFILISAEIIDQEKQAFQKMVLHGI